MCQAGEDLSYVGIGVSLANVWWRQVCIREQKHTAAAREQAGEATKKAKQTAREALETWCDRYNNILAKPYRIKINIIEFKLNSFGVHYVKNAIVYVLLWDCI